VLSEEMAVFCSPERIEDWVEGFASLVENEYRRVWLAENAFAAVKQYAWINRARRGLEGFVEEI
jgi:hypothetical protein